MTDARVEFSSRTRSIIAKRAGYQCSIPTCGRLTIGPGSGPEQVADIGVAGHIFSAAPDGPRGTGGLPDQARCSAANGIWLCADHGRLVDTNQGDAYPASLLQSWKSLHEARKLLELGGQRQPFGWLESLKFSNGLGALSGQRVHLGARNLIIGPNSTGKTALLRIIAGIGKPDFLAQYALGGGFTVTVRWYDPQPHELTIEAKDGRILQLLDGRKVPYVARPYRTILVPDSSATPPHTIGELAASLGVDHTTLTAILDELPIRVGGMVRAVQHDGPDIRLSLEHPAIGQRQIIVGDAFFSRVSPMVLAEVAIAYAQIQAEVEPTVLVFDDFLNMLHPRPQAAFAKLLQSKTNGFQVIMVTQSSSVLWTCSADWLLTEFTAFQHGFGINQDRTTREYLQTLTEHHLS